MTDQPYDVIETTRRYVLVEDSDGSAIRDRLRGNELVQRFPPTEEGIDLALARLDELKCVLQGDSLRGSLLEG